MIPLSLASLALSSVASCTLETPSVITITMCGAEGRAPAVLVKPFFNTSSKAKWVYVSPVVYVTLSIAFAISSPSLYL